MKRVIVYLVSFVLAFVICACTIYSLNWMFWVSLSVLAYTCYLMERDYKMLVGEIDDLFGHDTTLE